ncbi:hypothetical protein [Stenotrophomonas maltophilia]|nr:hypothetical protein [Stenotrophomonas maltophilia]MBH1456920.1 hypothetical protein [Stenotrophomonas maltophilia]MBN5045533.1 hypothetical protein [Stenotrophomonas maltophilia]HEL5307568.1 hypothetical protein [Stenotrophomonas maltophilia]
MDTLIFLALAAFLLCAVGALLVWAVSAGCRFLAALVADPTDTTAP